VEIQNPDGEWEQCGSLYFDHPYGDDPREYAQKLAQEELLQKFGADHIADLDWENCEVVDGICC
jgi:hypothetical protein